MALLSARTLIALTKIIFFGRMLFSAIYQVLMKTKKCIYCGIEKTVVHFPKHIMYKDKLDMRCNTCIKSQRKIRNHLHKTAPPKPEVCSCCGKQPIKWCLDHDHISNEFRGWICEKCNTGIGKLGDDVNGLVMALNYLLSHELERKKIDMLTESESDAIIE
jgi:hypothetical protein